MTVASSRELESRFVFLAQVATLYAYQATISVIVGDEERGSVVEGFSVAPAGARPRDTAETAPSDHLRIQMAFVEQELSCLVVQYSRLDES